MYKSVDEIVTDMSQVYDVLNADSECSEIYTNIGSLSIQINFIDLNGWVTQIVENGKCSIQKGKVGDAPVQEYISSETFEKIFLGEIEAPEAAMAGRINFEGDFSKMLLLQPVLQKTRVAFIKVRSDK